MDPVRAFTRTRPELEAPLRGLVAALGVTLRVGYHGLATCACHPRSYSTGPGDGYGVCYERREVWMADRLVFTRYPEARGGWWEAEARTMLIHEMLHAAWHEAPEQTDETGPFLGFEYQAHKLFDDLPSFRDWSDEILVTLATIREACPLWDRKGIPEDDTLLVDVEEPIRTQYAEACWQRAQDLAVKKQLSPGCCVGVELLTNPTFVL